MPLKVQDMRHRAYPIPFKDLPEGKAFCLIEDAEEIFLKLRVREGEYNAVSTTGLYATEFGDKSRIIPLSAVIQIYDILGEFHNGCAVGSNKKLVVFHSDEQRASLFGNNQSVGAIH